MIELNSETFKSMIDTGRPASLIDHKTARELTRCGAAEMRELNAEEKR